MSNYFIPYVTVGVFYGAFYRFVIRAYMLRELKKSKMPAEVKAQIEAIESRTKTLGDELGVAVIITWPVLVLFDALAFTISLFVGVK
jgi:hypothetical protein